MGSCSHIFVTNHPASALKPVDWMSSIDGLLSIDVFLGELFVSAGNPAFPIKGVVYCWAKS